MLRYCSYAFTLAELLIALSILGAIATFTIPKVLNAQQDQTYKTNAKEVISMLSGSYQVYKLQNQVTGSFGIKDLTPSLNYVAVDGSTIVDGAQNSAATHTCGASTTRCLELHNGGILVYWSNDSFSGTASTNGVHVFFDPDGKITDGTTNGPGRSLDIWLYADGGVVDVGNVRSGTTYSGGGTGANAARVPPWFSW